MRGTFFISLTFMLRASSVCDRTWVKSHWRHDPTRRGATFYVEQSNIEFIFQKQNAYFCEIHILKYVLYMIILYINAASHLVAYSVI